MMEEDTITADDVTMLCTDLQKKLALYKLFDIKTPILRADVYKKWNK